jgi:hypothetical protein
MGHKKSKNKVTDDRAKSHIGINELMNEYNYQNVIPRNHFYKKALTNNTRQLNYNHRYQNNLYYNMNQQMQQQAMFQEKAKKKLYSKQYADEALSRLFSFGNY